MRYAVLLALIAFTQIGRAAVPSVVISEVVANNQLGITDAEGDHSDWIELSNAGLDAVDLTGWYLSDTPGVLNRWQFPATNIVGGGRLVLFASGKNKRVPGLELHTNFQLGDQGETLSLVLPDGVTIVDSMTYPELAADAAYGRGSDAQILRPIGNGTSLKYLVPLVSADMPAGWTLPSFDDSSWGAGVFPVGFDTLPATTNIANLLTNLARGKLPTQSSTLTGFAAGLAVDGKSETYTYTLAGQQLPSRWEVSLKATYLIEKIQIFNRQDCCQSRLRDILVQVLNESGSITNFQSALLNPENTLTNPPVLVVDFKALPHGLPSGNRVRVLRVPDPDLSGGAGDGDEADVLSLSEVEIVGRPIPATYADLLGTDIGSAFYGKNATALLRAPFLLSGNDIVWQGMFLRFRYDDGFVAYLNGVEVLRRNVPSNAVWNSKSITNRTKTVGYSLETVNLTPFIPSLRNGANVFAVQWLNAEASDTDALFQPLLELSGARLTPPRFLAASSPGQGNDMGYVGVVAPVEFSVPRGFQEGPVDLVLSTATPDAEIRYTLDGAAPSLSRGLRYATPVRISATTVVRAVAYRTGFLPSVSVTHSYLFAEDIIRQTPQSAITSGFPSIWGGVTSDYGMDPRVIGQSGNDAFGGKYSRSVRSDLRSIPTLSLSLNRQDFFGPSGIYSQSDAHGDEYERDVSAELIGDASGGGFQINAGLRVQGGAFRSDGLTKKHSLRLIFSSSHGPSKLRYPLFGPGGPDRFDTLTLRANSNDGYSWGDAGPQPLYSRDTFGRETILDMQGVASHHRFVHLYLDGLYWGLYEMVERPDSSFSADHFGGEKEEYDSLNSGTPTEGTTQAWDRMLSIMTKGLANNTNYFGIQGRNPDGTRNPALTNYLDVDNMIDYMIVNLYGGNNDWPSKNYWVARRRGSESTGYKFYMWDSEWTLGLRSDLSTDRTTVSEGVATPYGYCVANQEFRVLMGDHLHRHFFNDGVLSVNPLDPRWDPERPQNNRPAARLWRITQEIRDALVPESARWGDMHTSPGYTRDEHWAGELAQVLTNYFPARSDAVLQQFRVSRLYPNLTAPVFSRMPGPAKAGDVLGMGAPAGRILYTLNGDDPRLIGGAISPLAQEYQTPIALPGRCVVKARTWLTNSWSALQETVFTGVDPYPLRVTEIHYRPAPEAPESLYFQDDSEFIELKNVGNAPLDMRRVAFTEGIRFRFEDSSVVSLAPGAFVLVVKRRAAFEAHYGTGLPVAGEFAGSLVNGGERVVLSGAGGEIIQEIAYEPLWYPTADGLGFSLVTTHPNDPASAAVSPAGWRPSSNAGGSPGKDDPEPALPRVVITEAMPRATAANGDFVELLNASPGVANISGWFLSDDRTQPKKYRFPANTLLAPGTYFAVSESQYGRASDGLPGFGLSGQGEEVFLFSANAAGELTGYVHGFQFGAAPVNTSWIVLRGNDGYEEVRLASRPTPGVINPAYQRGAVSFSQFYPGHGTLDPAWVTLHNGSQNPVELYQTARPTNTWRISGLSWSFPTNVILPSGGLCVITEEQPAAFRLRWHVPESIPVFGPFAGNLSPQGESLELQRPELFGNALDYVQVDRVSFQTQPPWPTLEGQGISLNRALQSQGIGPEAWYAALADPSRASLDAAIPPQIAQQPISQSVVNGQAVSLHASADGGASLRYQWFHGAEALVEGTEPTLTLSEAHAVDGGVYRLRVASPSGVAYSDPASITVLKGPTPLRVPTSRKVLSGTNVTFAVAAVGVGQIRYQWLRDGTPLSGATDTNLVLTSVQPSLNGDYTVRITDDWGSVTTLPANLLVAVRPSIVVQPFSQTVLEGQPVNFRVEAEGTLPMTYRWRKDARGITNGTFQLMSGVSVFTLPSVTKAMAGAYSVAISNVSGINLISISAPLAVLSDADRDGMADEWESQFGFNPADASDALLDSDGDGVLNRDEYAAGSDPKKASSVLRFDAAEILGSDLVLRFQAVSNRTFTVRYRDGVGGEWKRLIDFPAAAASVQREVRDAVRPESNRYYRIVTPSDP